MEFIFLPCSRFPSYSLIFLISQTACLYSLILELRNLSQVREEYKNFGDCSAACGWILPKFWEIVGFMDGQNHTKFHWHRTMYVKMTAKILLDFPPIFGWLCVVLYSCIQRQHSKTPFRKNIIITLYYHKTKNYILSHTQQLSLSTMLYLLRMFYISADFFPDLREVSISRTNSVPLVGRKLLRQAGQSHTVLSILLLWSFSRHIKGVP